MATERRCPPGHPAAKHGCNFVSANGKLYLVRCPRCDRENWAMYVSSGQCAWCGWKAEAPDGD